MIFANLQGRMSAILEELVNTMSPDVNRDQWLRGQYFAYKDFLSVDFEELKHED